jgi:uncharacterized membrane protein HdeD (DUF308 family)
MSNVETAAKSTARRMSILGVVTIVLGLAAMAAPAVTGLSIVLAVGLLVIVGGILRMLGAFWAGSLGKGVLAFVVGGLTLLCGLALVTDPVFAFGFLTIVIAVYLFADGIAEIVGAFSADPASSRLWLLVGGGVSILLGLMIWQQYPLSGAWAIGVLLGVKLLVVGTVMLGAGSGVRSLARDVRAPAL